MRDNSNKSVVGSMTVRLLLRLQLQLLQFQLLAAAFSFGPTAAFFPSALRYRRPSFSSPSPTTTFSTTTRTAPPSLSPPSSSSSSSSSSDLLEAAIARGEEDFAEERERVRKDWRMTTTNSDDSTDTDTATNPHPLMADLSLVPHGSFPARLLCDPATQQSGPYAQEEEEAAISREEWVS